MTTIPDHLSTPIYTLNEAANLVGIRPATLRSWARGRDFPAADGTLLHSDALVSDVGPKGPRRPTLPFVGLAEAAFLAAVRKTGVPMQRIRPALERLQTELKLDHALASRSLYTDGAELLLKVGAETGASERDMEFIVVRNNQGVFTPVVLEYLSQVTFGPSGYAEAIRLPKFGEADVIVDPRFGFGQPVLQSNGVQVASILERFAAGESISSLADDFATEGSVIEQLVRASRAVAA